MLENKWYHVKVPPQRFHLNRHTTGYFADSKVRTTLSDSITPSGSAKWWGTVSSNALVQARPLWSNAVAQPRLQPRTWQTESVEGVLRYLPCLIWCSAFGYLLDRQFNHCDVFKFHRFCKLWESRFSSRCYSGYAWISDWHQETQSTTQEAQGCKQTLLTFVRDR